MLRDAKEVQIKTLLRLESKNKSHTQLDRADSGISGVLPAGQCGSTQVMMTRTEGSPLTGQMMAMGVR